MNNYCLTCKYWDRSHENPDVGICALYNENVLGAYRFQFEDCEQWLQGDVREPFYVQGTRIAHPIAPQKARGAAYG